MTGPAIRDDNLALILAPAALEERYKAVNALRRGRARRFVWCVAIFASIGVAAVIHPAKWLIFGLAAGIFLAAWAATHAVFDGAEIRRSTAQIAELEALMRRYNREPPTIR